MGVVNELVKLKDLLKLLYEKPQIENAFQRLQNDIVKTEKKLEVGDMKTERLNHGFDFTMVVGMMLLTVFGIWIAVFFAVLILGPIIGFIWEAITLIGSIFPGVQATATGGFIASLLYWIMWPILFVASFFVPWIREVRSQELRMFVRGWRGQSNFGQYLGAFLLGIGVVFLLVILIILIVDGVRNLVQAPEIKTHNLQVRKHNQIVKNETGMRLNNYWNSEVYQASMKSLERMKKNWEACTRAINSSQVLHAEFKVLNTVEALIGYIETGRAASLKEAINKLDDDNHKRRIEQLELERNWLTKQTAIAAERAENYARQSAEFSRAAMNNSYDAKVDAGAARNYAEASAWFGLANWLDD